MKKIVLSVAILATCLTACKKKSDDPAPAQPTNTTTTPPVVVTPPTTTKTTAEYLTAHTWKTSGATADKPVNYDGDPNTPASADIWAQSDACEKDDIFTFNSNGTGTIVDAGVTCSSNVIINITWSLSANNKELIVNALNGTTIVYTQTTTINSINDNNLSISIVNTDEDGLDFIETDSFVK